MVAYADEDIDELRLRINRLVRENGLLILRNAALVAAGDKLAEAAGGYYRECVAFALHDAVASWRDTVDKAAHK